MSQEELRKEYERLFHCRTMNDCYNLLDIYAESLFMIVKNHNSDPVKSKADADAKMVAQMMLTKILHLKSVVLGISYKAKDETVLNKIIDPTIVASLTRNIYETTGMFNLIYRSTMSPDEKRILYLLWVHSGLSYRQRFKSEATSKENEKKYEDEKKELEEIVKDIEATELYKKLDEKNQAKIKTKLKEKDYLIKFEGLEINFLHWHDLVKTMALKEDLLENIYTYFSLYSHPSNVAVFQFAGLFEPGENGFLDMTNFNLKNAFFMISIFIADYINLFPEVLKTYNSLEIIEQIATNSFNNAARGIEYAINDSWKALG